MFNVKRDAQMRKWINEGPEDATPAFEDVVMWGVWFDVNGDEYKPPVAMFATEEEAKDFAEVSGEKEYAVSPCIVDLKTRDDFRIPAPEATP